MKAYGEAFQPIRDPYTGEAIPNSPLINVSRGGNGTAVIYMQPLHTPAPTNESAQASVTDSRTPR